MYWSKVSSLCSRILVYLVWPWYLIPEQQSCMQKTGSRLQDTMRIAEALCSPLDIFCAPWPFKFCMALSLSVHWHTFFYSAALSIISFFLGFCQWWSCADRILTLNISTWLSLSWSTCSQAKGLDSVQFAGLSHGYAGLAHGYETL